MCDQQKIGFFISRLADPKSLQLTVSFFMFDQMFKSTRPKRGMALDLLSCYFLPSQDPKNIHSWQNWPSIWEIKTAVFHLQRACFRGGLSCSVRPCIKPSPTNAFPLGPGALWQFNVRSHLVRSVGWSGGAWDYPLLGFYDVSWRLWALVLVGEHA